jgi:hypothetical protein
MGISSLRTSDNIVVVSPENVVMGSAHRRAFGFWKYFHGQNNDAPTDPLMFFATIPLDAVGRTIEPANAKTHWP